jgi:hypothetical protein
VEIILAALLAGVVSGTQNVATSAVKDAYTSLRDALKRRLGDRKAAHDAVEGYVKDPDRWKGALETQLKDAGADSDQEILDAAALVMKYADQAKIVGKYVVDNTGSTGNQFGDGNTQTFNFGSAPR